MSWQVLIAHADGEENWAEQLASPLRQAGYSVVHRGTVMVGESITEEASRVLQTGGPLVLCGTVKAMGTGWAHRLVNAARHYEQHQNRIFAVQIEQRAYLQPLALDSTVALYWENPTKAVKELIASLQKHYPLVANSRPDYGIPFQAPPLPTYFVNRPEVSLELKTRLLTQSSSNASTLVISAIHGLGAIGKSTLAAALAHDPEVKAHFSDGILWAPLGQQPDVLSLLSGWIQVLCDHNFHATSIEATSNHLRTLLYDKAVLLVVDDAWNTADVQAFKIGGPRCQVLVTTREAAIADVLGARPYSLDVMKPEQAMELLTKKLKELGRDLQDLERQPATDLAKAVGYLPLALELAAAQVADGISWEVLLQDLHREVARLKTLDRPEVRDATDEKTLKTFSLTASLNLSIQQLPEEYRENFVWLGVLPEDATITQRMTATIWEMGDERDAGDTLQYLRRKALLLSGVPLADGMLTYRLHDLMHDLACNLLIAPQTPKRRGDLSGLGLNLTSAHATLLERYQARTQDRLWHTLPDDGYIHARLSWHMEKAGWVDEIHQLLREETKSGRNGWHKACESLGQTANFVTSVADAWRLAENMFEECPSQAIALQCRYVLILTTLNSLAANLPPSLLVALLQKHVWAPEQGLAYALQSSNPQNQASLLTEIVDYLPPNLKEEALQKALAAARAIQSEQYRAYALNHLADKLPPELLPEALAAARALQDESPRAYALNHLADKLPPELLPEALAAARSIQYEGERASALSALASKLSKMQPGELFPLWQNTLHSLSLRTRRDFLQDIAALAPVIYALGDRAAVAEVACATLDVGRWWP